MKKAVLCVMAFGLILGLTIKSSSARPQYNKVFVNHYTEKNPDFAAKVKGAKCLVCHGKKKKVRNDYGIELSKLLNYKEVRKLSKEERDKTILDALIKVEKKKSAAGETYAERLKSGDLPGSVIKE